MYSTGLNPTKVQDPPLYLEKFQLYVAALA